MVKEPRAGRVKTRLGRDIGLTNATWWYRHQTRALLRRLRDPRWALLLSVAPDTALDARIWPADLPRIPQGRGDLGTRMANALACSNGPSVLIGSDIPGVTKHHIWHAFQNLRPSGSVIGPATDGGYWLVGLDHPNRGYPSLFKDVRWSGEHTLADTQQGLPEPIGIAKTLNDVDTGSDLLLFKNTSGVRGQSPR